MNSCFYLLLLIALANCQFLDHMQTADEDCSENNQYKCHNGRCVSRLAVCDGFDDCLDGSDEASCMGDCSKISILHYECTNGRCVTRLAVCDGFDDCLDGSDENNCRDQKIDAQRCERENKFACVDQKLCLPQKYVCNGYYECEDHSDEANCENPPDIPLNETCLHYKCGSGECISWYWVCDGVIDCGDRSDETHRGCFHKRRQNGVDNSTMRLCPDTDSQDVSMFYCKDKSYCVLDNEVCDRVTDCRDGSDERESMCSNWTTQCKYAVCDQACKPTPVGPRCMCGEAIIEVNNTCSNADYCRSIPSPCSQYCSNENRSYRCSCAEGYRSEKNLCFVTNHNAVLYYSTEKEIRSYVLQTKETKVLTTSRRPHSVVTDGTWLYWIEIAEGNHNVMRANLDAPDKTKEVFLGIGVEQPDELAVDWLGNNIYLTESQHGFIAVCTITGSVCTRLRDKNDIVHPRLVALDPESGFMYWADFIKVPRIQRAKMDGTDITTLTLNRIYPPAGLCLDLPSKKIYWSETQVGISVMNFDGSGKYELVGRSIYAPKSIAIFENDVYWDDYLSKLMQSISKIEGDDRRKDLIKLSAKVSGISIYHPTLHRQISHTCEHNSCSDICVVTGRTTYSCLCGEDSVLENNKHTCKKSEPDHYLIVAGSSTVSKIYFHALTKPERETASLDVGLVQALAYNPNEKVVYIFDSFRKVIHKLYMNSFKDGIKTMFIIPDIEEITDMGYDYYTDNLYYIEMGIAQSKLEVYSIKTERKSNLHTFEEKEIPMSLCVIPEYGMLMVVVYCMKEGILRVDRFGMDGNDRFNIYQTKYEGFHISIAYSADEDLLFISDPSRSIIEQLHPEGTGREHFRKVSTSIIKMAAVNKMLFWVNKFSSKLYWANIDDHGNTIGSMQLSKYAERVQLYLTTISSPKPLKHACTQANCTHVCVQSYQTNHTLIGHSYTCLCPPGQVLKNNVCTKKVTCTIGQLKCYKSNSCYAREKKCDGVTDCPNGEDEVDCPDNAVCSKQQYNCPYSEKCIERHQLCDGHNDCPDNSDEDDKYCPIRACHSDEFMCTNGLCIVNSWVCDGEPDCQDGVDERRCVNNTCEADNYRCRDGQCVDIRARCDGHKDCLDWSDEEACPIEDDILPLPDVQRNLCEGREYICASNTSLCLRTSQRCDGILDCPLGEDEIACDEFTCAPGYYKCKYWQQCIIYSKLCDGNDDCDDGSDENKESCFYKNKVFTTPLPPLPEVTIPCDDGYRCKNNKCIDFKNVCDNIRDCRDGSDEGEQCKSACSNRPCQHICKATPKGPQCFCHHGFLKDSVTNTTCNDIDECEWDVCSQECINIIGSYLCSCYKGFALRADGHTCKSIQGNVSIVYIAGNTLTTIHLHDGSHTVVHQDPTIDDMIDLDYDPKIKMLYVTTKKELLAIDDKKKILKVSDMGSPTLVAADWLTGNIYVVDETINNKSIKVCNLLKNLCTRLHKLPNELEVKALSIDPINRKMFYCTWHNFWKVSNIYGANLVRGETTNLQDVRNCTGLTVDYHKRMLYVAQSDGRIRKMAYNGRWGEDIVSNNYHLQSPLGLQLFEDHIYSLDSNTHRVLRCLNFGSKHCEPYLYRVVNAKSFVIRNENGDLSDGADHCRCVDCDAKQECFCYENDNSEDTLCVGVDENEYFQAFTEMVQPSSSSTTAWLVTLFILSAILCALCMYMYKANLFRKRSVWIPSTDCCNPRRRIVRSRLENPRGSWQFNEEFPPRDFREEVINFQHEQRANVAAKNVSFVNWLYSSLSRKKKERQYEPSVSVHLKPSGDGLNEPLAGSSGNFTDIQNGAESVASDTESEMDVKEVQS